MAGDSGGQPCPAPRLRCNSPSRLQNRRSAGRSSRRTGGRRWSACWGGWCSERMRSARPPEVLMNPSLPRDDLQMGRSSKITETHLQRKAIVYVRQSTLQQVTRNQESTRLQYALTERALQLGWRPDQIEVIDDLGRSGASAEG